MEAHGVELNAECMNCGKRFHLKPYALNRHKTHYCSKECRNEARKQYMKGSGNHQFGLVGERNASYKGGRIVSRYGYILVSAPYHPFKQGRNNYVLEHRLVAEKYLLTDENSVKINGKRYLSPEYVVHHKNHVRTDNRPENLEVMRLGEHSSMHNTEEPQPRDPVTQRFVSRKVCE